MTRWSTAVLWFAVCAAATWACTRTAGSRFPHRVHLVGLACGKAGQPACLDCLSCHQTTPGGQPGVPSQQACSACHLNNTEQLWSDSRRPHSHPQPIAYQVQFDHQQHLIMSGIQGQCVSCHSGAVQAQSTLFPPMDSCFACHEHQTQWDRNECGPCHSQADLVKLKPQTFMAHTASWLHNHGWEGSVQPERCQTCHSQASCDDCHALSGGLSIEMRQLDNPLAEVVHPADFLTRHAWEARLNPAECTTCHTVSSCETCHAQRGVSAARIDSRSPHPPGWIGGNPASLQFHGRAARRDLLACASCHDQGPQTNCIDCHRVGGHGGNPHPAGWRSSRTPNEAMCRYCHER